MEIHKFNLNDMGNAVQYSRLTVVLHDIVSCIDLKYGSNYADDAERGEVTVSTLLQIMHFGELVYLDWDETADEYVMVPFKVICNKENDSIYFFYSCSTSAHEFAVTHLEDWLRSCEYEAEENIVKLTDTEGYAIMEGHGKCIISNSNIYKLIL